MKAIYLFVLIFLGTSLATTSSASDKFHAVMPSLVLTKSKFNYRPPNGCVPDAKTALKIANVILLSIYGESEVEYNKPFAAILRKGVWTIGGMGYQPGMDGGDMEIDISKADGRILRIYAGM
jgi:hypothetical protein